MKINPTEDEWLYWSLMSTQWDSDCQEDEISRISIHPQFFNFSPFFLFFIGLIIPFHLIFIGKF